MKILVVDDDPNALSACRTLLERSGFKTVGVRTGAEALAAVEKQPDMDLVLLDLLLSDMSGLEVCRKLKAQIDHFLPVVLVTGKDNAESRIDGLESGADDYVAKPYDVRELLARLKALLRIKALHDEVRRLASVREQIVYTVSHDFRTPLVGIRGAIQNLLHGLVGPLSPAQREYLELVDDATRRLSQLTDEMCKAARRTALPPDERQELVDLRRAVETASAALRPEIVKRRLRFEISADPDAPGALGDPGDLIQVAANLLDNAVKFSPDGGRITVTISRRRNSRGSHVELVVADEGPGIARSDFERIFYRFEQVGDPGARTRGTGLGLAICKETVENHGGRIWVESEPGRGARFHVLLPGAAPVRGVA